ncbi:MAG: hypothetical protein E6Q34_12090 [Burkholderiaceae bacterium]|nr:MAG: hypothetical protein E6Q34_12090 [Burkholderiaceae bacterium]
MIHISIQQAYEIKAKLKDKMPNITANEILQVLEAANRVSAEYETALHNVHDAAAEDLREVLAGLRDAGRQAYRQIGLFLEDGQRERLIVAQAILDPKAEQEPQCIEYCGDLRHPDGCEPVGPDDEYRGQ